MSVSTRSSTVSREASPVRMGVSSRSRTSALRAARAARRKAEISSSIRGLRHAPFWARAMDSRTSG